AGNLVPVGNFDRGAPVDGATVEQVRIGAVRRTIPFGSALRARTEARAFLGERGLGVFTARDRGFIQTLAGSEVVTVEHAVLGRGRHVSAPESARPTHPSRGSLRAPARNAGGMRRCARRAPPPSW